MKYLFCLALGAILMASCSDASEEITSVNYARNFAPVGLEAKVRNNTNVELSWTVMAEAAHYIVEVYEDDELEFAGTPIQTLTVLPEEVPYTVTGLMGETWYSFRVKSVDANAAKESKWSTASIETGKEQIFKTVADEDIKAKQVTLRWPAGEVAATITLNPGNIEYAITEADIAAGAATITGLTPETEYTAVMKRSNGLTRGTISFTTALDLADTDILVKEGDDLAAAIADAPEGYRLVVMPGEYTFPAAEDKTYKYEAIKIEKDLSIKGLRESEKPIIRGRFTISNSASVDLDQIILDGTDTSGDQVFVYSDKDVTYDHLNIQNCEIKNYTKGFYYINVAADVNNVTINNTIIHDITCDGGDMFDSRTGYVLKWTMTNSTVYNSCSSRDMLRDNNKSSKGGEYTLTNNTFDGVGKDAVAGTTSNYHGMFYIRTTGNIITFKNNIVSNSTTGIFSNQAKTNKPTFDGNVYWNSDGMSKSGGTNAKFYDDNSPKLLDPQYQDAANGDFTIGNDNVKDTGAGDPRWYKTN